MEPPAKLYRYRPITDDLLDREIHALGQSYLYAPSFSKMNDPMEAFYETGGPSDVVIDAILSRGGKSVTGLYKLLSDMIEKLALISFSETHLDYPMWAYYASNFEGICLEFETADFVIGDLQNEELRRVNYAEDPLPSIDIGQLSGDEIQHAVIDRITRKRIEWAHEKEWRITTGEEGEKHYLDDTLKRVFLGPKIETRHADTICAVLSKRPVEVLRGKIDGYRMTFQSIKSAVKLEDAERVGAGRFDPSELEYCKKELEDFLNVPFEKLLDECRDTIRRPNVEEFCGIDISGDKKDAIYFWTAFKMRNGRQVQNKRYFDRDMQIVL